MATFKVGDRVRIRADVSVAPDCIHFLGAETRIVGVGRTYEWRLALEDGCGPVGADSSALEPLIDPKADEFIERIKKLAREPAPAAPKRELA